MLVSISLGDDFDVLAFCLVDDFGEFFLGNQVLTLVGAVGVVRMVVDLDAFYAAFFQPTADGVG